jgi:hypothetical protein
VAERRKRKDRMRAGYAKAEVRNREAREALEPLDDGERPLVVTVGAVASALLALSIVAGYVSGVEVDGEKPRLAQVLAPALLMGIMAWGMWRARYWAVLGFQMILVLTMLASALGLVQVATVLQALGTTVLLLGSGLLFYFLIRAMARIQMPEPPAR